MGIPKICCATPRKLPVRRSSSISRIPHSTTPTQMRASVVEAMKNPISSHAGMVIKNSNQEYPNSAGSPAAGRVVDASCGSVVTVTFLLLLMDGEWRGFALLVRPEQGLGTGNDNGDCEE